MQMHLSEYNRIQQHHLQITKFVFSVTDFSQLMLYNSIKAVRLKPDQPNQCFMDLYNMLFTNVIVIIFTFIYVYN